MFYTIYKITNKVNNKYYIGKHQTENLDDNYFGSGKLLRLAISKYGQDSFVKEILYIFDNETEMNEKERELVVINEDSYNLCEGGKGGWSYVNRHYHTNKNNKRRTGNWGFQVTRPIISDKIRQKITERMKGKKLFLGMHHSDKTRQIMSEKARLRIGSLNSQFGTCWITNGIENKKIRKEELDNYLEMGYSQGRKMNI